MKKIITEYYCDICGCHTDNVEKDIPVIFLTEQNEGRASTPHFCIEQIILCNSCKNKVFFEGNQIFAKGAMGSNIYFFKEKSDK